MKTLILTWTIFSILTKIFAAQASNKTLKWTHLDLDTWEAPPKMRKAFPYYLSGYDEDNRPIVVIEAGKWDIRSVAEEGPESLEMFEKYCIQAFHRVQKIIDAKSTPELPVVDNIVILDFDQFKVVQSAHLPTAKFLLHLATEVQPLILKTLHLSLVVNTNSVAHTMVNIIRPVFGAIFEKILVFGTNKSKWIPHVLKYCPKDQIAPWYGGNMNFVPVKVYG